MTPPAAPQPAPPPERAGLARALGLLVRYWACNMTQIHDRGSNWPGFGYSADEKQTLRAIAAPVTFIEFGAWLLMTVVLALVILGLGVVVGMNLLEVAIGGAQNMTKTPAALLWLVLALQMLLGLCIGLPAAMLPAALFTGKGFNVASAALPDAATTAHFYRRLWFQLARIAALTAIAVLALLWLVPDGWRWAPATHLVLPYAGTSLCLITLAYYLGRKK